MSPTPIRVMVVDDSAVVRETIRELLSQSPEFEVIATASDPYVAADKLRTHVPDVITLDIEMPRMDGLSFLKKLMSQHPLPVVVCSSVAERGSQNALAALEYGAVEILEKPKVGTKQYLEESRVRLYDAVRAAYASRNGLAQVKERQSKADRSTAVKEQSLVQPRLTADAIIARGSSKVPETTEKIVCIGASTGGTEALKAVLTSMPIDAPGIVVVQHMPEKFTAAFADRLNDLCEITVKEAANNDSILRGQALIAPGNRHMLVKRSGARYYVEVRDGPLVSRHRPSVDVLFRSAARYAGSNAIGVIMTGMGDDGARGMLEMHDAGAATIGQNETSCVVYGMPKEAHKRGAVDREVDLDSIGKEVLKLAGSRIDRSR